tara:strand:+ start:311 stop:748 length:438 start_codon:yes stop_codon:yes gene_type:complete
MRKLSRNQRQTLRRYYDLETVWQIEENIVELINKYSKDNNLKGIWKKMFINDIKYAFVDFYYYMPRKSDDNQMFLNNALRILKKYNIVPYDNVMSLKYNILSKFGNAWTEKRETYLRWCRANDLTPREYQAWRNSLELDDRGGFF